MTNQFGPVTDRSPRFHAPVATSTTAAKLLDARRRARTLVQNLDGTDGVIIATTEADLDLDAGIYIAAGQSSYLPGPGEVWVKSEANTPSVVATEEF